MYSVKEVIDVCIETAQPHCAESSKFNNQINNWLVLGELHAQFCAHVLRESHKFAQLASQSGRRDLYIVFFDVISQS